MNSIRAFIHYKTTEEPWGGSNSFLCALKAYLRKHDDIVLADNKNGDFEVMLLNTSVTAPGKHTSLRQIKRFSTYGYSSLFQYCIKGFKKRKVHIFLRLDGLKRFYADLPAVKGDDIQLKLTEFADVIIFQSEESRNQFEKVMGRISAPYYIISNGANQDIFNMKGKSFWNRKDPLKVFATSWSANPRKGFEDIARLSNIDNVAVSFVGNWPDSIDPGRVHIKPPVAQVLLAEEYKNNDVFFFPARNEACANVVYEALSCGLPVIYHPSGGTPGVASDYGVELHDDLRSVIRTISEDYDTLTEKIRSDHHFFSIDHAGSKYAEAIRNVLAEDTR